MCVWGVDMRRKWRGWVRMKWVKRIWDGELESWNAEQEEMLAWKGRFVEMPCCLFFLLLSPYLWVFRIEAIMHVSQWPPDLGHPSVSTLSEALHSLGTEQRNNGFDVPAESGLHCFSPGSVQGFIVSICRKGPVPFSLLPRPLTLQELQLSKWRQRSLPVGEVAQPVCSIL